jgi:hypothetical protein
MAGKQFRQTGLVTGEGSVSVRTEDDESAHYLLVPLKGHTDDRAVPPWIAGGDVAALNFGIRIQNYGGPATDNPAGEALSQREGLAFLTTDADVHLFGVGALGLVDQCDRTGLAVEEGCGMPEYPLKKRLELEPSGQVTSDPHHGIEFLGNTGHPAGATLKGDGSFSNYVHDVLSDAQSSRNMPDPAGIPSWLRSG